MKEKLTKEIGDGLSLDALIGIDEKVAGDDHDTFGIQSALDQPQGIGGAEIFVAWTGHDILQRSKIGAPLALRGVTGPG